MSVDQNRLSAEVSASETLESSAPVLVTGGAGYIGSHVVKHLLQSGEKVVVLDNLSTGFEWAVGDAELIVGDIADQNLLAELMASRHFGALLHFAANIWVAESVREPARYYRNNVANALNLFDLASVHGIDHVVFSSTAAVYGEPGIGILDEDLPAAPINPYGAAKMMAERILTDIGQSSDMRYAILRYFNVAGADPEARIGEATPDNQHLIKIACEAALGLRDGMRINGTDYPTPDGTCIRDYIHVEDLAIAHLNALAYLRNNGASTVCNCGYGRGFSVREVLDAVKEITGRDFAITESPRRAGDPPKLIAANDKIKAVMGWSPSFDTLEDIIGSAWRWEQELHRRQGASYAEAQRA